MIQVHRNESLKKFETNNISNSLISHNRNQTARVHKSNFLNNSNLKIKTLVLDMDETLLHSSNVMISDYDFIISFYHEVNKIDLYIKLRPGLKEFIEKMKPLYELIIFTASIQRYADTIINSVEFLKDIKLRYYRHNCVLIGNEYVKDLSVLKRSLKKIIIIDNSPSSYFLNKNNAIPIKTWINNRNDCELTKLTPILEALAFAEDITKFIPKFISNNILDFKAFNQIKSQINPKPFVITSSKIINETTNKMNLNCSKVLSEKNISAYISPEKVYLPDPKELHQRAKNCIEQIDKLNYDLWEEETPKKPKESKVKTVDIYLFSKEKVNQSSNKAAINGEIMDKKNPRPQSSRFLNYNIKISLVNKNKK